VGERTQALPDVGAGVEAHHGDSRFGRLLQHVLERIRLGEGHRNPVNLLVNGLLDQLRLASAFRVRGVEQLHIVFCCCFLGALAQDVPERVARSRVGDKRNLHSCSGCNLPPAGSTALLGLAACAGAGAQGHHGDNGCYERRLPPGKLLHDKSPLIFGLFRALRYALPNAFS
jgi:hypothetical protein